MGLSCRQLALSICREIRLLRGGFVAVMFMTIIALILLGAAFILSMVASIWFIVSAFRAHVLWGVAVLLFPIAGFAFLVTHWEDVRLPFLMNLLALGLFVAALFALPSASGKETSSTEGTTVQHSATSEEDSFFPFNKLKNLMGKESLKATVKATDGQRGYTGRTLKDVKEELGDPQGVIAKTDGDTRYYYPNLELISTNGLTVTGEIHR